MGAKKIHLAPKEDRTKPINLPSISKLTIAMAHIQSGHMAGGDRNRAGRKDLFPPTWDVPQVEAAIKEAYGVCKKVETQGDRVRVIGSARGITIEMWVNITAKVIETAYPKN